MAEKKKKENSSQSLNGESDLEGKMIIDSTGATIGKCKAVQIGDDGQIGLVFEVEINDVLVTPSRPIPYSAIGKITDVIELRVPIDIKIAKSTEELEEKEQKEESKKEKDEKPDKKKKEEKQKEKKDSEKGKKKDEEKEEAQVITITEEKIEEEIEAQEIEESDESTDSELDEELKEEIVEQIAADPTQSNATEQLSKALPKDDTSTEEVTKEDKVEEKRFSIPKINKLMIGLEESIKHLGDLFKLLTSGKDKEKIEAVKALTILTQISPELGLSLIPSMMDLSDDPQQDVRLAIAQQLEELGKTHSSLFRGYFLEIFENVFDEPVEDVRNHLIKTLQNVAAKTPEIAIENLEKFLADVIIGKKVPEVPAKVIHDATLKVVSGNFALTRIAIKVRLQYIAKGGKLGNRSIEELEDYNATLIGLTIIESFDEVEADKLVKSSTFKKLGSIFMEVILQIIEAYKEGSFKMLEDVVDKKIEIPTSVIERFYEIKIRKTLDGAKNIPMEVFLENPIISAEDAEQIIYRLVVQQKLNAAITMNNGKTFITALEEPEKKKKTTTKKSSTSSKKSSTTKSKSTSTKKKTTPSKKTSSSTKKSSSSKPSSSKKKSSSSSKSTKKKTTTTKSSTTKKS